MGSKFMTFAAVVLAGLATACAQSDAGITTAVKAKLAADRDIVASRIDVDTQDKVVTLTGSVETAAAKTRAVEIAQGTNGVARVVDNVAVAPVAAAAPSEPDAARVAFTDPSLTTAVKSKLLADSMVGGLRIDVDTENAVVTLTGNVKSQSEKDQALRLARETDGVKSVMDKLTVKP